MIRRAEEIKTEVTNRLRDGKGDTEMTKILKPEEFHEKGRLFAKCVLKPGTSIGYHQHVGDFESYYILSGEGFLVEDGVESIVKPGDLVYTDNMGSHSIENKGTEDLVFMALVLYA